MKSMMNVQGLMNRFYRGGIVAAGLLLLLATAQVALAQPTVNGLFYGDGDESNYVLYNTSIGGSKLWYTVSGNRLYVALVVDRSVNDNVFGNRDYTQNAEWTPPHEAKRLVDSEYAEFTLTIGGLTYTWRQGYGGKDNGVWISDETVAGGGGTPPPDYDSSSSFVWNISNYEDNPSPNWDMYVNGAAMNDWKSPFETSAPDTVLGLEGYPSTGDIGYSPYYQWEWPMVYEWSVDLSSFGPNPIYVVSHRSHHSPAKTGGENDTFPPASGGGFVTDYGDLPSPYPNTVANNGARHYIVANGAYLGAGVDPELDGLPDNLARGDDLNASDDEDGVQLLTPLIPGQNAVIRITAGTAGYLSAFIDWDGNGTLDTVTLVSATGPTTLTGGVIGDKALAQGVYDLTVSVPSNASGVMPARFRYTNASGQGGNSTTGLADTGEVEDYIWLWLGGYVWLDTNGNGVQDAGETGVNGVTVELLNSSGTAIATTTTANNPVGGAPGYYLFADLDPGTYSVRFTKPSGYEFTIQSGAITVTDNSDANPVTGITSTFTLAVGQNVTYVDAGLVAMTSDIKLMKTADPQTFSAAGDVISYTFTVQNTGNVSLYNVTINDPLVTVAGGPIASLAVGASDATTFTASYTVTQSDVDAGKVDNTATVNAKDSNDTPVSDTDDETVTVVNQYADVSLTKTVVPISEYKSKWTIPMSKGEQFVDGDYWLRLEYDQPSFDVWGPGNLRSGVNIDKNWHHVVGRFTKGPNTWGPHTMEILVDGVVVATRTTTGTPDPSDAPLVLGAYLGNSFWYAGLMDEVRLSRGARSDSWLQATHAQQTAPASFLAVGAEDVGVLPGFASSRSLTVNESFVAADLVDFPVLVSLSDTFLANDVIQSDGSDLSFTLGDGTVLPHEIELFDQTAGRLVAWVKVPQVSASVPTAFFLNYGNATPPPPVFVPSAVWDDGFMMVQHLNETSGSVLDSTIHGNDGAVSGASWTTCGLGNGVYSFNGVDQKITIPDSESIRLNSTDFTIEAWFARKAIPGDALFEITVHNAGPAVAHDVVVTDVLAPNFGLVGASASQGGYSLDTWNVGVLLVGASATLQITVDFLNPLPLTNTASLTALTPDPNLANNVDSVVVGGGSTPPPNSTGKPDFVVSSVVLTPVPKSVGEVFNATVTVRNKGDVAGDAGALRLWVSQATAVAAGTAGDAEQAVGMLAVGESRTLTFFGLTAAATVGTHHVRVLVDADGITAEKSEGNNQKTSTYTVQAAEDPDPGTGLPSWMKPDFVVTSVVLSPVPGLLEDVFTATVTVRNKGDVAGDAGDVGLWVARDGTAALPGEIPDQTEVVGPLAVGEMRTLIFHDLVAPALSGTYHCRAFVDVGNVTEEKSEGNNQKTRTYTLHDIRLRITLVPEGIKLEWNSRPGLTYNIERTSDIGQPFETYVTGIVATPPKNVFIDTNSYSSGVYYRIQRTK